MPAVRFQSQALQMPALSTSVQHTMRYIAEHGIVEEDQQDFQRFLTMAVEEYQTSGVQARVNKLVAVAFQHHGDNAEALCPVLVDIAKENQIKEVVEMRDGQGLALK
ncbi:hypothetical protein EDC04DRAFT_2610894 [Pisolithus marmoratus]|nr:hypothetical protein EDC04DRAFT_2610894 [Pisolithus marmoratus]